MLPPWSYFFLNKMPLKIYNVSKENYTSLNNNISNETSETFSIETLWSANEKIKNLLAAITSPKLILPRFSLTPNNRKRRELLCTPRFHAEKRKRRLIARYYYIFVCLISNSLFFFHTFSSLFKTVRQLRDKLFVRVSFIIIIS